MSIYTITFEDTKFEDSNTSVGKIITLINPKSKKILDVGCASGYLGSYLKNKLTAEVWGIEIDRSDYKKAAKKLDKVLNIDIENKKDIKKIKTKFDTIIFADVLEHLKDPQKCLQSFLELLSPNGEIIASIPNIANYHTRLMLFNGNWTYEDFGLMDKTHKTFFDYNNTINLFEKSGLYIEKIDYVRSNIHEAILLDMLTKSGIEINSDIVDNFFVLESDIFQYIIKAGLIKPEKHTDYLKNKKDIVGKSTISSKEEVLNKAQAKTSQIINDLTRDNLQMKQELENIKSSKTFIYWQKFNDIKKILLKNHE